MTTKEIQYDDKMAKIEILYKQDAKLRSELRPLERKLKSAQSQLTEKPEPDYSKYSDPKASLDRWQIRNRAERQEAQKKVTALEPQIRRITDEATQISNDMRKHMKMALVLWVLINYPRASPDEDARRIVTQTNDNLAKATSDFKASTGIQQAASKRNVQLASREQKEVKESHAYKMAAAGYYNFNESFAQAVFKVCDQAVMGNNRMLVADVQSAASVAVASGSDINRTISTTIVKSNLHPCNMLSDVQVSQWMTARALAQEVKVLQEKIQSRGIGAVFLCDGGPVMSSIVKAQGVATRLMSEGLTERLANAEAYTSAASDITTGMKAKYGSALGDKYERVFGTYLKEFISGGGIPNAGKTVKLSDFFPGSLDQKMHETRIDVLKALSKCQGPGTIPVGEAYRPTCATSAPGFPTGAPPAAPPVAPPPPPP